jgi:hypothetical protein
LLSSCPDTTSGNGNSLYLIGAGGIGLEADGPDVLVTTEALHAIAPLSISGEDESEALITAELL